jgi:hypothetical protein
MGTELHLMEMCRDAPGLLAGAGDSCVSQLGQWGTRLKSPWAPGMSGGNPSVKHGGGMGALSPALGITPQVSSLQVCAPQDPAEEEVPGWREG